MKLRSSLLALAGFALLATVLFVRTTGLHLDEWNYLKLAEQSPFGDCFSTGKPPLFYWMNYQLHHEVARLSGPLKPVTIYLFYIAAFAASLVWAIRPCFPEQHGHLTLAFLALLVSPLALLNETQVMMETASLSAVSLAFGAGLRGGEGRWKWLRLFLLSALVVALKVTGISAVALLGAAVWHRSKRVSIALAAGAIAGILLTQATLRWVVRMEHAYDYGGPSEVLNPTAVWTRLTHIHQDLYVWLFFVGIAALVGVTAWAWARRRSAEISTAKTTPGDGALVLCALGSLVFMLLLQAVSVTGFPRYNYPVLWLGLLASVVLATTHRAVAVLPLAAVFVLQSSPLWGRSLDRFSYWPSRIVVESVESGGTILMDAPVHRLVVQQLWRDPAPCYSLEQIDPHEASYYARYFIFAFPLGRASNSRQPCAPAIRVWRDPVEAVGPCPVRCEASHRWSGCGHQRLVSVAVRQGLVLNQVCW